MVVGNKFGYTNYKPWRSVAPPQPKREKTQFVAKGPPPVLPRPNGSVYVYVYDTPGSQPGTLQTVSHSGRLPPNAKIVVTPPANGPTEISYPKTSECVPADDGRVTPEVRIKERSKKAGKGYKILADVNPRHLRSSSRGGKMFMKQKQRMEQYTSMPSDGKQRQQDEAQGRHMVAPEKRDTPWNLAAKQSSVAVKYMPAQMMQSSVNRAMRTERGMVLPRVSEVPPEWRARVEADYFLPEDEANINTRRWNAADAYYKAEHGPEYLRPRLFTNANANAQNGNEDGFENQNQQENGTRPRKQLVVNGTPTGAMVNFDARLHRNAPHRKYQGDMAGRGVFLPNCSLDFNARAVGWSRAFAEQY